MILTVNGAARDLTAPARTHLADLLREHLGLTGTHLGCEQGVCGACTVLLDGAPARACLLYAHEAAGHEVTTIEGLDDDPTASALRAAFTRHHALQCGYCTPGMMITARDIVLRLGPGGVQLDEARIREELAGNLCRCTGYRGIVRAIAEVAATPPVMAGPGSTMPQPSQRLDTPPPNTTGPDPTLARPAQVTTTPPPVMAGPDPTISQPSRSPPQEVPGSRRGMPPEEPADLPNQLSYAQPIALPLDEAWAILSDPARAAACLPGASLIRHDGEAVEGALTVALGPISARLAGTGTLVLDQARYAARLTGQGHDGANTARGEVAWNLESAPTGCILHLDFAWRLTGPLAQFSRPALLRGLVGALAADFARNLEAGRTANRLSPWMLLRLWLRGLFSR